MTDNNQTSFSQTPNGGRQHVFQVQSQPNLSSPSQQHANAGYPNNAAALRSIHNGLHALDSQNLQHKSPYTTPYAQNVNLQLPNGGGLSRANGNVSAEQAIAQGVLNGTSLLGGGGMGGVNVNVNGIPQRRPPPLGKTIHMTPLGGQQNQSMSVNHAMNPIGQAQQQHQSQNGSPALQSMNLQQQQHQSMTPMSSSSNMISPGSAQDLSMIDPQLAIDQQLGQDAPGMMVQMGEPQVVQGEMLSPPPGGSFPTFDALFSFAQAHALAHGYAFVIGRSKRDNRGLKKVFLICDRGGTNKEKVRGEERQRKTKSRKCGCEFGVFGLENKTAWLLRGRIDGEHLTHNHPPSDSPTEHPGARKLDPKAIAAVKALEENGVSVKETLEILHRENPSVKYLPRDIYNARAAIKRDPSRVEASAMEELPTFYKKPPLTFEEKLRAELRTEVANANAETEKVREMWKEEVRVLREEMEVKDKQIKKFEQFIDICNERVMARREELDGAE